MPEISSAIAIRLVLFGLMAPVAAALIESYGVRRIVIAAITLIVSGLLLALVMTQMWHLERDVFRLKYILRFGSSWCIPAV